MKVLCGAPLRLGCGWTHFQVYMVVGSPCEPLDGGGPQILTGCCPDAALSSLLYGLLHGSWFHQSQQERESLPFWKLLSDVI